jgi:hypothetical protein
VPSTGVEMKSFILYLFIAISANSAAWQRHIQSGKGDSFDSPQPHPLSYFVRDPFLRDDGDEFCADCTPRGKATVHGSHTFKTERRKVGTLFGFLIYDVFYYFDGHVQTGEIDWKSILVEVSPGQFREIYHLQPTAAHVEPSFIMKVGSEEILVTRDLIPGTGNNYYEDYFQFSPSGSARIDTEVVTKAVRSVLPTGYGVWKGGGLNMADLRYHMPVWKDGDANCCPTGGSVDVRFHLDGNRIIVNSKLFDPSTERVD